MLSRRRTTTGTRYGSDIGHTDDITETTDTTDSEERQTVRAIVIYESLTGNTRDAGHMIAARLTEAGVETVASAITEIDLQALSEAELVIVGSWTDGFILFGHRPGRVGRLARLPVIDGKKAAVYCTYAINAGATLEKLAGVVERRGGDVVGGTAIKRNDLEGGADDFVDRLLGVLDTEPSS